MNNRSETNKISFYSIRNDISLVTGHICNNFVIYYKCFLSKCQGKKTYNRLNFFIRHLQLEHEISDFKRVKEIIENSTYEKRKSKKQSRIRAKTLEGHSDDIISEDLKELLDYAKGTYSRNSSKLANNIFPSEIINNIKRQREKNGLNKIEKLSLGASYIQTNERGFKRIEDRNVIEKGFHSNKSVYSKQIRYRQGGFSSLVLDADFPIYCFPDNPGHISQMIINQFPASFYYERRHGLYF